MLKSGNKVVCITDEGYYENRYALKKYTNYIIRDVYYESVKLSLGNVYVYDSEINWRPTQFVKLSEYRTLKLNKLKLC